MVERMKNKHAREMRGSTQDRILDVAEDVFARYGYLAARLDDIAATVGIRRPSLFHHFRNKETLYRSVLDRALRRQAEFFDEVVANEPTTTPEAELDSLVDATFEFLAEHPQIAYLTLHTVAANLVDEVPTDTSTTESLERWQRTLERGRAAGVFRDVGVAECMALIGGMTTFYIAMPGSRIEMINAIREIDRERMRTELRRLIRTLVILD